MKKVLLTFYLAVSCLSLTAQRQLTLTAAIGCAQDSTIKAAAAEATYESRVWQYRTYQSTFKPHLDLSLHPNYVNESFDPDKSFAYSRNFNLLSTVAGLELEQKVSAWGGDLYVSSSGIWSESYNAPLDARHQLAGTPLRVGYKHDLIGYNPYRWEKAIEEAAYQHAVRQHDFELRQIALETTILYFDAVRASSLYDMYVNNEETARQLYEIGAEKYKLTFIRNDELATLKLQQANAETSTSMAKVKLENALSALNSYLGLPTDTPLHLEVPTTMAQKIIDREQIHRQVEECNPVYADSRLTLLKTQQRTDKARHEVGVQAGIDVNVGLQNYSAAVGQEFLRQNLFSVSGLTVTIPIINQGTARNRLGAARFEEQAAELNAEEQMRQLRLEVDCIINDFENCQRLLPAAYKALEMANEAFSQANENCRNGIADFNTFVISQSKREEAYINYLSVLQSYWQAYYTLSMLSGQDL